MTTLNPSSDLIYLPTDIWSDEPPLESDLHLQQIILLLTCLESFWSERNDYYATGNLNIYYNAEQLKKRDFRVPDFFVVYKTKLNKMRAEIVEIKPKKQSIVESKQRNAEKQVVALNHAKWESARAWCKQQGLIFRVVTEEDIFRK